VTSETYLSRMVALYILCLLHDRTAITTSYKAHYDKLFGVLVKSSRCPQKRTGSTRLIFPDKPITPPTYTCHPALNFWLHYFKVLARPTCGRGGFPSRRRVMTTSLPWRPGGQGEEGRRRRGDPTWSGPTAEKLGQPQWQPPEGTRLSASEGRRRKARIGENASPNPTRAGLS
jgi:hypothetical protein